MELLRRRLPRRVSLLCVVATLATAALAEAQTTALFFDSQPGDYIGQGMRPTYLASDGTFQVSIAEGRYVSARVTGPNHVFWWYLDLSSATNAPLAVGSYYPARRFATPFASKVDFGGSGPRLQHDDGPLRYP